ncbi:MAG: xseA [Sphingobacteriales bacterium]|nr:xseA [Sphingobacteriales bacterium]
MADLINDKKVFTLLEVTTSIKKTLSKRYNNSYWIKAEMNKINLYSQSGHCYPELVEKANGKVIAQIKGILWRDDYQNINKNFLKILKEPLKDGIKILFLARITFDPTFGLALQIVDIDPAYTLGDLEKEKHETIARLKKEDFYDRNRSLQVPLLPQRIAIISHETSKGYADFLEVLESNSWNYSFLHLLFPSLLQGEKAIHSIISQLKKIEKVQSHFDVVAIIRGGGSDVGLSCYNNYELARTISLFPIPVITGIGHATNQTVVELVAHTNAITPTKIAEYLLQKFHNFSIPVQKAQEKIIDRAKRLLNDKMVFLHSEVKLFKSAAESLLSENRNEIALQIGSLSQHVQFRYKNERRNLDGIKSELRKDIFVSIGVVKQEIRQLVKNLKKDVTLQVQTNESEIDQNINSIVSNLHATLVERNQSLLFNQGRLAEKTWHFLEYRNSQINNLEKNVHNMSPINVLKRGYSISLYNGKAIKSYLEVNDNDEIETILFDGTVQSFVHHTSKAQNL